MAAQAARQGKVPSLSTHLDQMRSNSRPQHHKTVQIGQAHCLKLNDGKKVGIVAKKGVGDTGAAGDEIHGALRLQQG